MPKQGGTEEYKEHVGMVVCFHCELLLNKSNRSVVEKFSSMHSGINKEEEFENIDRSGHVRHVTSNFSGAIEEEEKANTSIVAQNYDVIEYDSDQED